MAVVACCNVAEAQPPVVVIRRPVVRPAITYPARVVRTYPVHPFVYRNPVVVQTVVANPDPIPVHATVLNPEETGVTLRFTVRGIRYVLAPGAQQDLYLPGPRSIEFDRGGSFGVGRRILLDGAYAFAATDQGWTLRRLPD